MCDAAMVPSSSVKHDAACSGTSRETVGQQSLNRKPSLRQHAKAQFLFVALREVDPNQKSAKWKLTYEIRIPRSSDPPFDVSPRAGTS